MFLAFVATVVAARIPFDLCDKGYPGPISVDIPECSSMPFDIHIGDEFTVNIKIHVKRAVQMLPVRVTIFTDGQTAQFGGDACGTIENGCPKEAGDYLISYPVQIDGFKPDTMATFRVEIYHDLDDVAACGSFTTKIKDNK